MRFHFLSTATAVGAAALLLGTACDIETACTARGCDSGFTLRGVDADGRALASYTGTVSFGWLSTTFACLEPGAAAPEGIAQVSGCGDGAMFVQLPIANRVASFAIEAPEGRFDGVVEIDFEPQFFNGDGCGVTCEQASLQLVVE